MPSPSQLGGGSPVVAVVESESEALTGPVLVPGLESVAVAVAVVVPLSVAELSVTVPGVACESLRDIEPSALSLVLALALALVVGVTPTVPELALAVTSVRPLALSLAEARPSSPQPRSVAPTKSEEKPCAHCDRIDPTTAALYHPARRAGARSMRAAAAR